MAETDLLSDDHEASNTPDDKSTLTENYKCSQRIALCTRIADIFIGKTVLVTGATGFLGKVLVEKLLRSCPGIKEILILIRESKKGSTEARMEEYIHHHIFKRLRETSPEVLNKLKPLSGDITLDNAGLCLEELQTVITEVSFVFHCAANVRFEDKPREIMSINLVGVQTIIDLCKKCQELEAFVHVSTAYAFCNNDSIAEQLYPEIVRPEQIIEVTKWMTNTELRHVCCHYMQGRPSLYPFSKAMAEMLVVETCRNIPAIIVRPSIVTASAYEPYPGWVDNFNGPSGFIHVCGKGVVKTLLVEPEINADWVPVDIVANTLIAAAHYLVVRKRLDNPHMRLQGTNDVPIVNCTCPEQNTITWIQIVKQIVPLLRKYPSMDVYNRPGGTVTSSLLLHFFCRMTYHYIPAVLLDILSVLTFRKPRMLALYVRIHGAMSHLEYYTTRSFKFNCLNMRKLVFQMHPEDRKVFPIDQAVLNWSQYLDNYVIGVRRYFSRESDATLPDARKRMMRFYFLWLTLKLSSMCGILMFLKRLYKRGSLRTFITWAITVLCAITTRLQITALQPE